MASILGFYASSSPSATGIKTFRVPGTTVLIPVKAEVAPILIGFAREFHLTVEPLRAGWCWGYAWRAIRGAFSLSKHAPGIAIDLNAPRHPLGRRGTFSPGQVRQIRALCQKYGLKWGGDWSRPDEMHFEIIENRSAALARVRKLQSGGTTVTRPPAPAPVDPNRHVHKMPVFRLGSVDPIYVRDLQGHLNYWRTAHRQSKLLPDGKFGPATDYVLRLFQMGHGLKGDGICGPATWAKLHHVTSNKRLESDGRGF